MHDAPSGHPFSAKKHPVSRGRRTFERTSHQSVPPTTVPVLTRLKGRWPPMRKRRLLKAYACTLTGLPIR